MTATTTNQSENINTIRSNIRSEYRANNLPEKEIPQIIAVSKMVSPENIIPLLNIGHRAFGENRIQEAAAKWPDLKKKFPNVELHLIGPLQTNKVNEAIELFDVIQTVDREKLASALAKEMEKQNRKLPCFIQVNTGEEGQKSGILPENADEFIALCQEKYGLQIAGLMCIPPQNDEPALHFGLLRKIAGRNNIKSLSMGMSSDYSTASCMGATHIRVGTAIFGKRDE